jgi:hypothetical protein
MGVLQGQRQFVGKIRNLGRLETWGRGNLGNLGTNLWNVHLNLCNCNYHVNVPSVPEFPARP